jgi:hypothetical protein
MAGIQCKEENEPHNYLKTKIDSDTKSYLVEKKNINVLTSENLYDGYIDNLACCLKKEYKSGDTDGYSFSYTPHKNNINLKKAKLIKPITICTSKEKCKQNIDTGIYKEKLNCDDFFTIYCAQKLKEYMSTKDNTFDMTKYDNEDGTYDALFNPNEWKMLYPECSCYGYENYPVYKQLSEGIHNPPKTCYYVGCGNDEKSYVPTHLKDKNCGSVCINLQNFSNIKAGVDVDIVTNVSQSCGQTMDIPIKNEKIINNTNDNDNANKNDNTNNNKYILKIIKNNYVVILLIIFVIMILAIIF